MILAISSNVSDITARTGRDTSTAYIESSIDLEEGLKTLTAIINKYGEGSLVIDNYEPSTI